MTPEKIAGALLELVLSVLGPAIVQKRVDEWQAGKFASDVKFLAKFGIQPDAVGEGPAEEP